MGQIIKVAGSFGDIDKGALMKPRNAAVAVMFGILAMVVSVAAVAWACTGSPPSTTIGPKAAVPNSEVTVSGTNWAVGPVEIRWNDSTGPVLAQAHGPEFAVPVTVPADAQPDVYYLIAVQGGPAGVTGTRVAETLEVVPAAINANGSGSADLLAGSPARSASGDLWSAFAVDKSSPVGGMNELPADRSSPNPLGVGLALLGSGAAVLFAALALIEVRRRRALASSTSTR